MNHAGKGMRRKRKIQLNNKGISLIELIVALLVLTFVVAPLLAVFLGAANTNRVNTMNADADIVAQNIMEAIKVYGLDNVDSSVPNSNAGAAKQVVTWNGRKSDSGETCLGVKPESAQDLSQKKNDDDEFDYVDSYNSIKNAFVQNNQNKYIYELTGVKEGEHLYNVRITFDSDYRNSSDSGAKVNEVTDVYDFSAFASESTVFINPISKEVKPDEEILENICELNAEKMATDYDEANIKRQNDIETKNAMIREFNERKERGEIPEDADISAYYTLPVITDVNADLYKTKYPNDFYQYIDRIMYIDIAEEEKNGNTMICTVSSYFEYVIRSNPEEAKNLIDGRIVLDADGNPTYDAEGKLVTVIDPIKADILNGAVATIKRDDEGEGNNLAVYIMYIPYPYMSNSAFYSIDDLNDFKALQATGRNLEKIAVDVPLENKVGDGNKVNFTNEQIVINNTTGEQVDVYLVVQGSDGMKYDRSLPVNVTNSAGRISHTTGGTTIYTNISRGNINISSGSATIKNDVLKKVNEMEAAHLDKLVNVTITVYNDDIERSIHSTIQK